ncbi:hypothetical protein N9C25_00150 [Saprospiraceae bacterium]|nr:hypothetical protein [Saprospiraceae bacterium]
MPKKIFYIIFSLCLIAIISFLSFIYIENYAKSNPDSRFFSFSTKALNNCDSWTQRTVKVEGLLYNKKDMTLYNGTICSRIADAPLRKDRNYEYEYLNGKIHGYYYGWTYEGWIARGNYREGEKHGLFEEWYENGQLKSRGNYSNGEIIDLKEWYIDGKRKYPVLDNSDF